jgi:hypothetical protein
MSMNFSEFKKLIGADPGNRDPETLRARQSAPEFEAAAREAEAFEKKLQGAVRFQPPADLLQQIEAIGRTPVRKRKWLTLAMAASLLVAISAGGLYYRHNHYWDSVESYVAQHYGHDGTRVIGRASVKMSDGDIEKVLAKLDATADTPLSRDIMYVKFCPTPDGRGAHMVVSTSQGLMTVIYMPEIQVKEGEVVKFGQMHATLVNLEKGSAAIIGNQSQNVDDLVVMVRDALKTGLVDA